MVTSDANTSTAKGKSSLMLLETHGGPQDKDAPVICLGHKSKLAIEADVSLFKICSTDKLADVALLG